MVQPFYSLSLDKSSLLQRVKEGYLIWINIMPHMSKGSRFTLGTRIENKFINLLELTYLAYYSQRNEKIEKILESILILDTLKFIVSIAWEAKLITNKQYEEIALKLNEVGKMFGGWKNSLKNPQKNRDL